MRRIDTDLVRIYPSHPCVSVVDYSRLQSVVDMIRTQKRRFSFTSRKAVAKTGLLRAGLLFMILVCLAAPIYAHPAPYSYLDLRLMRGQLEAVLVAHVFDLAHDLNVAPVETLLDPVLAESKKEAILNLLRSRLLLEADGGALDLELLGLKPLPERQALALYLRFQTKAFPGVVRIHCALFPYDPQHQTFMNVYEDGRLLHQEIFDKDHVTLDFYTGSRQGTLAVVKKFIPGGVYHIFTGPDHILFIVGLLLAGGSLLRLLAIVSAFTLAHSITLSLAALDVVNLPARLIEPAIALSIIYVGIDNLMVGKSGQDVRVWVAFFFGLVHGFGFAGVLKEFGLPRQALGWSLFSFNFGVEIGQVCIVVIVASLLAALRSRNQEIGHRVATVGSVCVILAGSYWFIQRVFFMV
ncbi:MAG: HupE/UreJ family protein [Acidobacteria bacterium]|nr:HupE/UreJ family protein [Acidobacteriota bacterium]